MSPTELTRLEAYLRDRFSDPDLAVRSDAGTGRVTVFMGGEVAGYLLRDEDEGEVSYDFSMKLDDHGDMEAFLKAKLKNEAINLRSRPNKEDSAEVYSGEEFVAVLFKDDEDGEVTYDFNMAILDIDLEEFAAR